MTNYFNGGFNGYQQPFYNQPQPMNTCIATFVSNIAEAIATKPDVTGKPLFFYNKANEEVYIKQYDNTGNAPVKTYKLSLDNNENQPNPYLENFKSLDEKLEDIKKLLSPFATTNDNDDKRNRR